MSREPPHAATSLHRDLGVSELELRILTYIHRAGPVFLTKLAKRLDSEVEPVRQGLESLLEQGYLEHVTGALVEYRLDKRSKVSKHRNHRYYALSRKARQALRRRDPELDALDLNLRPPYKQA
jgi:predicted ArsR family transcriptional regulator